MKNLEREKLEIEVYRADESLSGTILSDPILRSQAQMKTLDLK